MNQFPRFFYQGIYRPLFEFQKPALLAVVHQKALGLYGYNRTVSAGKFKAVRFPKRFNVAVLSATAKVDYRNGRKRNNLRAAYGCNGFANYRVGVGYFFDCKRGFFKLSVFLCFFKFHLFSPNRIL